MKVLHYVNFCELKQMFFLFCVTFFSTLLKSVWGIRNFGWRIHRKTELSINGIILSRSVCNEFHETFLSIKWKIFLKIHIYLHRRVSKPTNTIKFETGWGFNCFCILRQPFFILTICIYIKQQKNLISWLVTRLIFPQMFTII